MVIIECVILSLYPPYLEIDQLMYSILRRHISSVFRQFPLLLLSYDISLRISWATLFQEIGVTEVGTRSDLMSMRCI
jgi:hypothetical protein